MIDIVKAKIVALDEEIQFHSEKINKAKEAKVLYEALIKEAELKSAESDVVLDVIVEEKPISYNL